MRNIIYLDEGKLFSLSSQLFSGSSEFIIREEVRSNEEKVEQKGPISSGRLLADAMRKDEKTIEKRVLHDFAYASFEDKLLSEGVVSVIDAATEDPVTLCGSAKSFVKITARAEFVDARKITDLFSSFNKFGAALNYVQVFGATEDVRAEFDRKILNAKTKPESARIKQEKLNFMNSMMESTNQHLIQDEKFLQSLALVTEYGYEGNFEVIQKISDYSYSSVLKRDFFRESSDLVVRKYSRTTSVDLVLVGIVTQAGSVDGHVVKNSDALDELPEGASLKKAVVNLSRHMGNIERSLTGKDDFEVVVDPIALYVVI